MFATTELDVVGQNPTVRNIIKHVSEVAVVQPNQPLLCIRHLTRSTSKRKMAAAAAARRLKVEIPETL